MRKFAVVVMCLAILGQNVFADINIGAGGTYSQSAQKFSYSFLFEYLFPIVPGILKAGPGAQYFSSDGSENSKPHMPIYAVAVVNVVPTSFFVSGRYGFFLTGDPLETGGTYYAAGVGYNIAFGLYVEAVYTVYQRNDSDLEDDQFTTVRLGISL
ncbi:MAG: hypothetical protein LBB93_01330 [Elusimicrobiota bacterium]|nr:hypothetical protein [Elusimicrobiota bacterium]